MGLDVFAYEHVELVRACSARSLSPDDWDDLYKNDQRFLSNLSEFTERGDGLPEGVYAVSGATEHWASSYGGYNRFRHSLAMSALGVKPELVWDDYESYRDRPFAPLIHFADNEGFLGPKTCARLLSDAEAIGTPDLGEYDGSWPTWFQMFKIAAGTGIIYYT